ncbi:MAG: DNA polymerase III subunit beta [Chloroflexi bacterium GWB2_54_36]|nr:MAG: DNA polymerase III subunit beta [Chloroflexi bacterium GWB2_54_36]HBA91839.1 DNA polymerase III subunit beta [Anaerolineaceae bacterium]
MKVSVQQQHLSHGLGLVSRAVSPRSTLPVLANILVATDEGRLRLSATNLELGISSWIPAQIGEDGAITVPARTFVDLVSALPNDMVHLALNTRTQTLTVTCGSNITDIKGIDAQEFPPMPVPDLADGVSLNVSDFKEMIQQVVFAASNDDARPVLQGVLMTIAENQVTLAATDGFRISVRKALLANPVRQAVSVIIPGRALSELARIAADGDQTLTMNIPAGRGQVVFRLKEAELVSQLIDGNFPDYKAIIPRSSKTHTILSVPGFLKACKQAEIIAREGNNVVRMNILPQGDQPGVIEISAQSEETGTSDVKVDANIDGPALLIAFNVKYLREVLDVLKTPSVALETNQNNTPATLRPIGDDDYVHVIMPMHLG